MLTAIITQVGLAKINAFKQTGEPVAIDRIAVGDGGGVSYNPTGEETALRNTRWIGEITDAGVDGAFNWYETELPADEGGYWVREYGLFSGGVLIAIGKLNSVFKMRLSAAEAQSIKIRAAITASNQAAVTVDLAPPTTPTAITQALMTVGQGGTFETLGEALKSASAKVPTYANGGIDATILLLEGFVLSEQVAVHGLNLGWLTIEAEDEQVAIDASEFDFIDDAAPVFEVSGGGVLPKINALFYIDENPEEAPVTLLHASDGATAVIAPDAGLINAPDAVVIARSCSRVSAAGADFTGAGGDVVKCTGGAIVDATGAQGTQADVYLGWY